MLSQSYSFSLKYEIQEGKCTCGYLFPESKTASLVCLTTVGKLLLYSPNHKEQISFLNINKKIDCMSVSSLNQEYDKLIISSENTLFAYDLDQNYDVFYKDVSDGITALCQGKITLNKIEQHLAFVGGNCSIYGYDKEGEEIYWNVTGGDVTFMYLIEKINDMPSLLIVSADDFTITIFKSEEILFQLNLNQIPLFSIGFTYQDQICIAYALENGEVGVFKEEKQLWIDKDSQSKVINLIYAECEEGNNVGEHFLIVGRRDGSIEIRQEIKGIILQKIDNKCGSLSALLYEDLRGTKSKQIIAIYSDGTVKGYMLIGIKEQTQAQVQQAMDTSKLTETIEELSMKKNDLLAKIGSIPKGGNTDMVIPKDLKIELGFVAQDSNKYVELVAKSNHEEIYIAQVILQADPIFQNYVYSPAKPTNIVKIPLKMMKINVRAELSCQALCCVNPFSQQFQIVESKTVIPKFSNFCLKNQKSDLPISCLSAQIKERIPRFVKWIDQCFIVDDKQLQIWEGQEQLKVNFKNVISDLDLIFMFNCQEGVVQIYCDSIEVVGEIIQDLAEFLNLSEIFTEGEFPLEMENFKQVLKKVQEYKSMKVQLNADVAECINNVKQLIVKAEESRLIGNISYMKRMYANIMIENDKIQDELLKKTKNQQILMEGLREVSKMISKASDLRVGNEKQQITTQCRNAIKKNNLYQLVNLIQYGKES